MAGRQGVVNIGLNVDYQKSLDAMIQEFRNTLTKISSEFKKTALAADLEAQITELAKTTQAQFDKINNGKLDAKNFKEFKTDIESQLTELESSVKSFQSSLDKVDGSKAVRKILKEFRTLKDYIVGTSSGLSDFYNIVDKLNNIENKGIVTEYENAIKAVQAYGKAYEKVYTDFGELKPIKAANLGEVDKDSLYTQLDRKIEAYKALQSNYKNILENSDVAKFDTNEKIETGLIELQANIAKTAVEINGLRVALTALEGEEISIGLKKEDLNSLNNAATEGFGIGNIEQELIVAKSEISNFLNQAKAEVSSFQFKDGAIQVPVKFNSDSNVLKEEIQKLIDGLQAHSQSNPVKINVIVDTPIEDINSIITPLKEAFENIPISIRVNKNEIANEIKESVRSVISETPTDSETIQAVTQANKSLETQAEKTSTAIENEAKSAQSASEKFRKLAKEKGNATIANRELAKAAKETADALEREVTARKETESSRGGKNAVDSSTYSANALEWQRKIKQELLDSGNYAEVYNAKISQTAKGNVSFASSVQTMDGEWKSFTATLDNSGSIVSSKLKDLNEKQVTSIERAKEQARQLMEAYAAMASGEGNETAFYNKTDMEEYLAYILEVTQSLETLNAKYKVSMNSDGGLSITKTINEANGEVKTFVANFSDVESVLAVAVDETRNFGKFLSEAFDSGKVSASATSSVISQYEEIYNVAKKLNGVELKLNGLDGKNQPHQVASLTGELRRLEQEYSTLISAFQQGGGFGELTEDELEKLNAVFTETSQKISKIKAKLADSFVSKGNSAIDSFEKKYSGYEGFDDYSAKLEELRNKVHSISDENGLKEVREEIAAIARELDDVKTNNANEIRLGTKIDGRIFSDINELRANIVSVLSTIGEVNEKSIKVKGAKSLTAEVKQTNGEIHNMTVNLDSKGFAHYVDGGIAEFKRLGSAAESVFKGIKDLVRIYLSPQDFIRYFRQGFDVVTEVDTALTELIKVSDASNNAIAEYFDGAVESAKELGSSVTDMISATADWKRNGYSLPESKQLAETAILYKNVGDGIDIEDATSSIISTLQGFQLEADAAEGIVDKFNAVSNAFSIESGGIGDALQRSAAAFNAANTDLSQSIALITATRQTLVEYVETHIKNVFNCHRSLYYFTPQYRGNYYMTV